MCRVLFIFLFLGTLSCSQKTVSPISFVTRGYEFNAEIGSTLQQTGEVGFSATRYSFVSEHHKLLKALEVNDTTKQILQDSIWASLEVDLNNSEAKDYIISKAGEHEIIMFNENHYLPRHRNFVKKLLPSLYESGYRYLALEAIGMIGDGTMWDKELSKRGYPLKYTGHYIKDPEFSLLIREAIDLNFHIIGYDEGSNHGYSGGDREERGAENILAQMKEIGEPGKLIVLCGWDHLREGSSGTYWDFALAERLKQKTGHDPLTINQTEYNERLDRTYEDPLMQRLEPKHSLVLLDGQSQAIDLAKDTAWYDAFVIHPRTKFKYGIPDWILKEGPTKKYNFSKLNFDPPFKIFVFETGDVIKTATPIFVCEVSDKSEKVVIPTRGKKIKLVVTNSNESVLIE